MNGTERPRRVLGRSVAIAVGYWVAITAAAAAMVHAVPGGPAAVRTGEFPSRAADASAAGSVSVLDTFVRLLTFDFGQSVLWAEPVGTATTGAVLQTATLLAVSVAFGVVLAAVGVAVGRRAPGRLSRSIPEFLLGAVAPLTVVSGVYTLVRVLNLEVPLRLPGPTEPVEYAVMGLALGLPMAAAILRALPSLSDPFTVTTLRARRGTTAVWAYVAYLFGAVAVVESAFATGGIGTLWVLGIEGADLPLVLGVSLYVVAATLLAMVLRDVCWVLSEEFLDGHGQTVADGGAASVDRAESAGDAPTGSDEPTAEASTGGEMPPGDLNAILNRRPVLVGFVAFFGLFVLGRIAVFLTPSAFEALDGGFPVVALAAEVVLAVCFVTLLATTTASLVAVAASRVARATSRDVSTPIGAVLGVTGALSLVFVVFAAYAPLPFVGTPSGFQFWIGVAGGLVLSSVAYRDVVATVAAGTGTVASAEAHGIGRAVTAATYVGFLVVDLQFLGIGPWDREGGALLTLAYSYNVVPEYKWTAVLVVLVAVGLPTLALQVVGAGLRTAAGD